MLPILMLAITVPVPAPVVVTLAVAAKLQQIAFQAARDGDTDTLSAYFAAGRDVNETNARGDTLLTVAAYSGQEQAVAVILMQPKVTVDARNKMGLTALSAASFKGHVGIARKLVAAKADVNVANASKQTPLMFAALAGRTEMVDYLLSVGADPRAADASGNTPLKLATTQGARDVVKRLEVELAKPARK